MSSKRWVLFFVLLVSLGLAACGGDDDGKTETLEIEHSLVNGSVVVKLPKNWVSEQNEWAVNKFEVLSDAKLREEQDPSDGAMGSVTVEIVDGDSSPAELLAAKLDNAGGAPDGSEIETLEIGGRPAARMAAMDEMFGQKYLWHTTLIQFDDGVIVYADFMGLGKYEKNDVINAVVETITVDSAAFMAIDGDT